jgi:folate-binding protein YgfZ
MSTQVLELTGVDAIAFAQSQFCNDVCALSDGQEQWNAWLSPQGRVLAFFRLLRDGAERLRLRLRGGEAEHFRAALARYVFRARVTLRATVDAQTLVNFAREDLADIRAGIPFLDDALRDQLLPQWLGLDRLGAVSVSKGCYPGQEIMARLHFKGGNKRSLYRIRSANALPVAQIVRDADGAEAGTILMCASAGDDGYEALASLIDARADGAALTAAMEPIEVLQRFA